MKPRRRMPAYDALIAALSRGPMDQRDVAIELGLTTRTARDYLNAAWADKAIHVTAWWKANRGPWSPAFALGDRPNMPAPPKQTADDRRRAERRRIAKKREDVTVWYAELAARRAKRAAQKKSLDLLAARIRGDADAG